MLRSARMWRSSEPRRMLKKPLITPILPRQVFATSPAHRLPCNRLPGTCLSASFVLASACRVVLRPPLWRDASPENDRKAIRGMDGWKMRVGVGRMSLGEAHVLACAGWVGEKVSFVNILRRSSIFSLMLRVTSLMYSYGFSSVV